MVTPVATSKKRISLYLDEELKYELEKLAKARKRSLSNLIEVICEKELTEAKSKGEVGDD